MPIQQLALCCLVAAAAAEAEGNAGCRCLMQQSSTPGTVTAQYAQLGNSWETQKITASEHKTRETKYLEILHLAHDLPGRNQVQHITAPLQDLIRNRFLYINYITDTGLLTSAFHNMRPECQTSPKQPEARKQGWATEIFLHDAGSTTDFIFFAHCQ